MRNVSICFYVSQQHVECFQIADKRCKIKQQLCSRGSHSASPTSQPARVSYSRLQQQQQTIQNDRQNPRTTTNFGVFEQRLVHGVMGTNFSHSARASVLQSSLWLDILCVFAAFSPCPPPIHQPVRLGSARAPWLAQMASAAAAATPVQQPFVLSAAIMAKTKPKPRSNYNSNSTPRLDDGQSQQYEILSAVFDIEHDRCCFNLSFSSRSRSDKACCTCNTWKWTGYGRIIKLLLF